MNTLQRRFHASWRGGDNIGRRVRSHYAARWTGIVERIEVTENLRKEATVLVTCRVTHDSCGNPMRKTFLLQYGAGWLELLPGVDHSQPAEKGPKQ